MDFSELVVSRRSVKSYQPDMEIPKADLVAIFDEVVLSPSAFNIQHWMFIAVVDGESKGKLQEAAYNQPQVGACSAAIVVCGKLDAWRDAEQLNAHAPKEIQERVVSTIHGFYDGKEQLCRDEAIRGASLAAMSLMYAAKNRGYETGPMIGFDSDAVSTVLGIPENYIPVMLVVLGKQMDEPRPRDPRRPLAEVVKLNSMSGPGLST